MKAAELLGEKIGLLAANAVKVAIEPLRLELDRLRARLQFAERALEVTRKRLAESEQENAMLRKQWWSAPPRHRRSA